MFGLFRAKPVRRGSAPLARTRPALEALEERWQPSFLFTTNTAVGGQLPSAVAVADFNGDSKLDVATANANSNTISVLLGVGNGTFTPAPGSPRAVTPSQHPVALAVADFNGDTKPDLAVVESASNAVTVLLGNGDGTFATSPASPVGVGSSPDAIVVGDFNGDQKFDFAVANNAGGNITVRLGQGDGTFTAAGGAIPVGSKPTSIVAGDFNGDSRLDLATANNGGNTVSVLLGNGNGTFSPGSAISTGSGTYALAAADLNGDDKLDLAVVNITASNLAVLLGNGDATFAPAANSPYPTGVSPQSVIAGDFNGDGKLDLATANKATSDVTVLNGDGTGKFTADPLSPASVGSAPLALASGDFNNNGRPDLVTANSGSNNVSVLLNTVLTQNQRWVAKAYRDLLGRTVDPSGLASWTDALDRGAPRGNVAYIIENTNEYRMRVVESLYVFYLHRAADSAGLSHFVNFLAQGGTTVQIAIALAGSPEYFQIRGHGDNNTFLNALYQDALQRPPDPNGRAFFLAALSTGTSTGQVASAVLGSLEHFRLQVQIYYQLYLNQPADPAGRDHWANFLQQDGRDEIVIATILGSDAYYARL